MDESGKMGENGEVSANTEKALPPDASPINGQVPPPEHRFSSENQPAHSGRKKGIPNKDTVFSKYLCGKLSPKLLEIAKKASGEDLPDGITMLDALVMRLSHKGLVGDVTAIKEVFDRLWGKAQQHIISEDITDDVEIDLDTLSDEDLAKYIEAQKVLESLKKNNDDA